MAKSTRVCCPICQKENDFFADPLGPFCSQRCKLIDLGKWLGEEYRVSEPLTPDHFTGYEDTDETDLDRPEAQWRLWVTTRDDFGNSAGY